MEKLTTSRVAQLGGVNLETMRYYERPGLLQRFRERRGVSSVFPRERADVRTRAEAKIAYMKVKSKALPR